MMSELYLLAGLFQLAVLHIVTLLVIEQLKVGKEHLLVALAIGMMSALSAFLLLRQVQP